MIIFLYLILSPFLMVLSLINIEIIGLRLSNLIPFTLWAVSFSLLIVKCYRTKTLKMNGTLLILSSLLLAMVLKYLFNGEGADKNPMFVTFFWVILYFIGINLNFKNSKKYLRIFEKVGFISVFIGIILYHLNIPLYSFEYVGTDRYFLMGEKYRAMGTFVNPNAFAYFMVFLYIVTRFKNNSDFLFIKVLVLGYGIFITYSRSALLIYLLVLLVDAAYSLYRENKLKYVIKKFAVPVILIVAAFIIINYNRIANQILRVPDLINNPRWEKWEVAWSFIFKDLKTFLIGNDLAVPISMNGITFSDNQFLYFALYYGLIGFVFWLAFFINQFINSSKAFLNIGNKSSIRKNNFNKFILLLSFCLMGLVSNIYFIFPISFYLPLFLGFLDNEHLLRDMEVKKLKENRKINILYILGTTTVGGGPNHVYTLLSNLDKKYKAVLVCPNDGPFFEKFNHLNNVRVKEINIRKVKLVNFIALLRLIKEEKIHLIHSHGKGAGLYSRVVGIIKGKKVVHTFHGIHYHKDQSTLYKVLYLSYEIIMSFFTNYFINVSQSEKLLAEKLKILLPINKSKVIFNAVDIEELRNQSKISMNNAIYENIKKLKEENYLLYGMVANFYFAKGHEFLIQSLSLLDPDLKIKLILIGDGPLMDEMVELAKKLNVENRVLFLGSQDGIYNYLTKIDVFVLCSRWEGMPISLIEAMYAGKPIIGTNVVGIKEIVRHMENGLLVESESPTAIANAINLMYSNDEQRKTFGKNSVMVAESTFSLRKMIDEVEEIYDELT
ncbi:glycosyltransferase [Bacillus sp. EB106-08-02-XG196]|uniref:glycosyltransferase n=1 Tax=Bacillus sp. EB106-08-02-XG196 TaxID=2737049 RepID=UPI00211B34C8|nr:glycosyltransferase [Bacillus sp. EB106-08-02-XG196]